MSDVYSFRSGPTYRGASRQEMFDAAMEQPLSLTSTLMDQAKGGILESFGLGTAIRDFTTPEEAPVMPGITAGAPGDRNFLNARRETPEELATRRTSMGALSEDQYKASSSFRDGVPYDPGMTEQRAAALASMNDAKQVRDFYAQKRPFAAFIGNIGGQALDPINYVPIAGPWVKAAAVGRYGRIAGEALTAAADAASNTALFGIGTAGERAKFGDDVSWQSTVSQIATAALIGSAFGAIGGAVGRRVDARLRAEAETRLGTLRTVQESRIALNEGIDALVQGEDVRLSPNSTEPMARVAQEIAKTDTPAAAAQSGFSDWFNGSKAVDATGEPVVVYHGTGATFDQFKLGEGGPGQYQDTAGAIFFSSDERVAKFFAKVKGRVAGATANVKQAVLSIKNPAELDFKGERKDSAVVAKAIVEAKAAGHDGLHIKNVVDGGDGPVADGWVAFSPDQIKAAPTPAEKAAAGQAPALQPATPRAIDTTAARPEPTPEGIKQSEASVAKPDDAKALAAQYRIDPETGAFHEEADIKQLAAEGRFTEQDAATMAQAQTDYETGSAYAEALKSVAGCLL